MTWKRHWVFQEVEKAWWKHGNDEHKDRTRSDRANFWKASSRASSLISPERQRKQILDAEGYQTRSALTRGPRPSLKRCGAHGLSRLFTQWFLRGGVDQRNP
ncbi:hypothetical protein GOP47_0013373 [Adiantum capillus-veneris]|uniref:Uncharacterized protein n=1 Tax=Adiantum capillus-veneris TaxID=13818 RepID=A0A9D4ZEH0_ADICA|nr:hypothetical protein GOP47_0013373 [Adiantum capillus-veneris]